MSSKHGGESHEAEGPSKKTRPSMSHAYKCSGSCAAATDRAFKCGAPDCDKKGVALELVESTPVVFFCDGECKGASFTPVSGCGDKECSKFGVPLVAKVLCESCTAEYGKDGKEHACEDCTSVIDVSKLPEIVYATEIVEKEEDKPASKHHNAYKCSGSCAAATDRPFKCGAETCDKKGVSLDKVDRPVVYFCDAECKGASFSPTGCGDKECSKSGVPLVAKVMCDECSTAYDKDGNPHACETCTSVIRTSALPDEVVFTTDITVD